MRIILHTEGLSEPEKDQLETQLAKKMPRLRRLLDAHHPAEDEVKVDVHVKASAKKKDFECEYVMELPRVHQALVAKETSTSVTEGLDAITQKMETQITKHFKKLVRE
jgi:ribosome-associated translation inhibitor RaiA